MYTAHNHEQNARPSALTQQLLDGLRLARESVPPTTDIIHVSELTSIPAFVYEKLRNFIDYKDELLLRKNATKRYLKRRFLVPRLSAPGIIAQGLVRELILSRYLKNDAVPTSVVGQLEGVIDKYQQLLQLLKVKPPHISRWREAIIGLAAVECDAYLVKPSVRVAYTAYAVRLLSPLFTIAPELTVTSSAQTQLILSVQRVLDRADNDMLTFTLLRHYAPAWYEIVPLAGHVAEQAPSIAKVLSQVRGELSDKLGKRLLPHVKRLLMPVVTLRDVLDARTPDEQAVLVRIPKRVNEEMAKAYQARWQATRRSIRRKGFHAMAYIFLTKVLLATLVEYPYERFIIGHIAYLPLSINLLFPPLLMAIITLMVKSPAPLNEERVLEGAKEMVYGEGASFFKPREMKHHSRGLLRRTVYALVYAITMAATLGGIILVLKQLGFNPMSGALFLFFISLVSFFGISLRQQARQLKVVEGRDSISAFIIDFFSLPVVAIGKWISTTFDRVNIFVFILDFLFEAPFKIVLKVIEEWFQFLKEKKDEMY